MKSSLTLRMQHTIQASATRLFEAWTDPEQLVEWWGPAHVRCSGASVDLRVGGRYYLDNELPDGRVVRIEGEFERVEPPTELVYSWQIGPESPPERVTVRFEARGTATEVTIVHERIATIAARDEHRSGWLGCLDGLAKLVGGLGR